MLSKVDLLPGSKKHPMPREHKKSKSNVIDLRTGKPIHQKRVQATNLPGVANAHIQAFKEWKNGTKG